MCQVSSQLRPEKHAAYPKYKDSAELSNLPEPSQYCPRKHSYVNLPEKFNLAAESRQIYFKVTKTNINLHLETLEPELFLSHYVAPPIKTLEA